MAAELKDSVFTSGPNEALDTVDVYSPEGLLTLNNLLGILGAGGATDKSFDYLSKLPEGVGLSFPVGDLLDMGISPNQLRALFPKGVPTGIDLLQYLRDYPGLDMTGFRGSLAAIADLYSRVDLDNLTLIEFERLVFSGIEGSHWGPGGNYYPGIEVARLVGRLSELPPVDVIVAVREILSLNPEVSVAMADHIQVLLAAVGNVAGAAAVNASGLGSGSTLVARMTVERALASVAHHGRTPSKLEAVSFVDLLISILATWGWVMRGGVLISDLTIYGYASRDALYMMLLDPRVAGAADICTRISVERHYVRDVVNRSYQYLSV